MLGVLQHVVDGLHLFLHEVAEHLAVLVEVVSDDGGRGVLTVSGAEGVVHIDVGIAGELLGEVLLTGLHLLLGLVVFGRTFLHADGLAFLLRIEAEVLEQQGLTRLQGCSLSVGLGAVGGELHLHA